MGYKVAQLRQLVYDPLVIMMMMMMMILTVLFKWLGSLSIQFRLACQWPKLTVYVEHDAPYFPLALPDGFYST